MNFKSLILTILMVLVCVGGIVALKFWPESPQRVDDTALKAAMDTASRQLGTAQNLLAAPVISFKGEYPPIAAAMTADNLNLIDFPPRYTPNLKAQQALRSAYDALMASVREHPAASGEIQAMAHILAGRIVATEGYYHSTLAVAKHRQVAQDRRKVSELVSAMQQQGGEIAIHKIAASLNLEEAEKALQDADKKHKDLLDAIQKKEQDVAKAQKEWESLRDKVARQEAKAIELRLAAEQGKPREQLAKMEEVHKLEREEIYPQYRQIDRLEAAFKAQQAEMERLKAHESVAKLHVQAARRILDGQQGEDAASSARGLKAIQTGGSDGLRDAESRLAACRREVDKTLELIGTACKEAAQAEAQAAAAYKTAVERFKAAIPIADKPAVPQASCAETLVTWSETDSRSLRLHAANTAFLNEISQAWPKVDAAAPPAPAAPASAPASAPSSDRKGTVASLLGSLTGGSSSKPAAEEAKPVALGDLPPVAENISKYMLKPGEVRQEAAKRYNEAIELYKKALASATPTQKWLYQGALGAAYAGLARVADQGQRAEALANASAAFNEALQGKEGSPFLAPVVDMQGQVSRQ